MSATLPLKVILFDDNQNIRESIALLLTTTPDLRLIASFETCLQMADHLRDLQPDIVLMDIDMPGMSGINAVRQLRNEFPELPVLMLTIFEDDEKVFASICAGANGYILKNAGMHDLIRCIREVHQGGAPMTPVIARKVLNQFARSQQSNRSPKTETYDLSNREMEVLQLLVKGLSYKMIADHLSVSYETVHSHIRKIYRKLHVNSLGEAVSKALIDKIIKPD